jgi:stage III sporulation protein AE
MAGVLLMFSSIITPILEIIVFSLALKLISAIVEPLGNSKLSNLISGLAKNLQMLVAMIASVSFMYILVVGLVMCSANII